MSRALNLRETFDIKLFVQILSISYVDMEQQDIYSATHSIKIHLNYTCHNEVWR